MMKKIILLLTFFCVSLLANAQATCNQTFSATGLDNDPTVLTINATDLTCNGVGTITSLQLINASTPGNCAADGSGYFNFSLSVDGGALVTGCGSDFDNIDITGFITLTITSADTDNYAPGDDVTITIDVEVTFTPTTAPNCDSVLTSPANGDTLASIDGNLVWSAASGGVTGYNLTVGTTPGGSDILATTDVGNVLTYVLGTLAEATQFYITVEAFNAIGVATSCIEQTFTTYTPVAGDICAIAFPISCGDNVSGTTVGATSNSAPTNDCGAAGAGGPGLWYSFTGNGDLITASLCGSTIDTKIQVYEGSCDTLICVDGNDDFCGFQSEISFVSTASTQYFIYVYGYGSLDIGNYNLDVSCRTIESPVTTDIATYSVSQLIEPVLVDVDCANVSNTTFSSHSTGADIGISYFTDGGGSFPFADGIVLSSGRATDAKGPYESASNGFFFAPGDADLENVLGLDPGTTFDASSVEFDFVPLGSEISFNFILASSEYNGSFECTYGDAFAFILTHIPSGTVTNLAVLPTTDTATNAVAVTNVHPDVPFSCGPANEQYFDSYSLSYDVIGYSGRTVPLTAQSVVVPGDSYHIKLVIADEDDSSLDTAVFLEGGSFSLGTIDLGNDVFLGDAEALCEGDIITLNAGVLPAGSIITWYKDGVEVTGTTNGVGEEVLDIDETGDYAAEFTIAGTDCSADGLVHIEFYPNVDSNLGEDKKMCANEPFELTADVSNDINPLTYEWAYNGVVISGATSSTYTVLETIVESSNGNADGAVQFENPVDGTITYVDILNGVYSLGDFTVTVTDNVTGCNGTDTIHIDYYENANCVDLPTGISPNGDGINDCIVFDNLEDIVGISTMQIFNRYGTTVYENGQYEREWCGTNKDGDLLPTGTYYYILNYEDGRTPIKSWIYINREN